MTPSAPDPVSAESWAELAAAIAERWAAAFPGAAPPGLGGGGERLPAWKAPMEPPRAEDLRRWDAAIDALLARYFDKAAWDDMRRDFGASDGTVPELDEWTRPETWTLRDGSVEAAFSDYPDDARRHFTDRGAETHWTMGAEHWYNPQGYGRDWIRSREDLPLLPAPGAPLRGAEARAWFAAASALLSRMRHIRVGMSNASVALAAGGPRGIGYRRRIRVDDGGSVHVYDYPYDHGSGQFPSFAAWASSFERGSAGDASWEPADPPLSPAAFAGLPDAATSYSLVALCDPDWGHGFRWGADARPPDFGLLGATLAAPVGGRVLVFAAKPGRSSRSPLFSGLPEPAGGGDESYYFRTLAETRNGFRDVAFDDHGAGYSPGWNVAGTIPPGGGVFRFPAFTGPTSGPPDGADWARAADSVIGGTYAFSRLAGIRFPLVLFQPDFQYLALAQE